MTKGHFEAKKHAYRQTQDGVVVSFVIHPSDVPADLATAALGTVYMIGFAKVDELPDVNDGEAEARAHKPATPKAKRKFDQLPPSQQAALRCTEFMFCEWLDAKDDKDAARLVRKYCSVDSRALLDTNKGAAALWHQLNTAYVRYLGQERAIEMAVGHGYAA